MSTYIQTYYGKKIDFFEPDPDQIDIRDIAHALVNTPRFSGQTSTFYPVAAHSIMVAAWSEKPWRLQGLLHDSTEAYLTDMPTPFKRNMPQYQEAEARVWDAICTKFDLPRVMHESVKWADKRCLMTEADALQPNRQMWEPEYEAIPRLPGIFHYDGNADSLRGYFMHLYEEYGGI